MELILLNETILLNPDNDALAAIIAANAKDAATDIATLFNTVKAVINEKEVIEAVNKELTAKVESLSKTQNIVEAASKTIPLTGGKSFDLDGITYAIIFPKNVFEGVAITVSDVLGSVELQRKLIAAKSSMVKQLVS